MKLHKHHKNFVKSLFAIGCLMTFGYIMIYADQFKYEPTQLIRNTAFVDTTKSDVFAIDLSNVTIDDSTPGTIMYVVTEGDNLASIASKFGTTISNIQKVNGIRGNRLSVGSTLHISQEDGILYEVPENTNLLLLANQYNLDIDDLKSLNYIGSNDAVLSKGDQIFINISEEEAKKKGIIKIVEIKPEVPKPIVVIKPKPTNNEPRVVVAKPNTTSTQKPQQEIAEAQPEQPQQETSEELLGVVKKRYYKADVQNSFAPGFCTWYAAIKKPDIFQFTSDNKQKRVRGGNANQRFANAKAAGYPTGSSPRKGALVTFSRGGPGYSSYGHVGVVVDVDFDNNRILIEDMNYYAKYVVTQRRVSMTEGNIQGYIY